jgi:hypothetical protein
VAQPKLKSTISPSFIKLFIKLFRRRPQAGLANSADATPAPVAPVPQPVPPKQALEISLSAEQKCLLEKPLDPRVDRILHEIYEDKAAAERALNARHIIEFPPSDSGEGQVIQDEHGFWRIVPGPAPTSLKKFSDKL